MIIGEIIKRRRTALDMTQVELAEKAKITQAKISQIENGANDNVTIDVLRKLAKALNCVVVDLLPDKDKLKTK
jgi:transcriptional regulator with XRE-family HTH domain